MRRMCHRRPSSQNACAYMFDDDGVDWMLRDSSFFHT